jgi:hypothetical protein
MVLNFTISSGGTTKQPTPSPDSSLAMKDTHTTPPPPRACSRRTYSSHPSSSRKMAQHPCQGAPLGEDNLKLTLRIPLGAGGPASTLEADPGTLARPIDQAWELEVEIVVVARSPGSGTDW